MSSTTKTVLLVAGVAAGVYVVLQIARTASKPAPAGAPQTSDGTWVSAALNFGSNLLKAQPAPTNGPNVYGQVPVYVTGSGYVQGGGNAPIDPTTGGVYLPPGEEYGPVLPS